MARTDRDVRALLQLALTSGDDRLATLPESGRNRYGVPARVAADEVWFASSTASAISKRGANAAFAALTTLLDGKGVPEDWPEAIRERLGIIFGIPDTQVILTGSGTEAELVVLALARTLLSRPVSSIILAPAETGSGVRLAAEGRYSLIAPV